MEERQSGCRAWKYRPLLRWCKARFGPGIFVCIFFAVVIFLIYQEIT